MLLVIHLKLILIYDIPESLVTKYMKIREGVVVQINLRFTVVAYYTRPIFV